jgi:hypothetical protein
MTLDRLQMCQEAPHCRRRSTAAEVRHHQHEHDGHEAQPEQRRRRAGQAAHRANIIALLSVERSGSRDMAVMGPPRR